jgi:hypothetical protein
MIYKDCIIIKYKIDMEKRNKVGKQFEEDENTQAT